MNYRDVLDVYELSLAVQEYIEEQDYDAAYNTLKKITLFLLNQKTIVNDEWRLRITELLALGVSTPLKIYNIYGKDLDDVPDKILDLVKEEIGNFQHGLETLLIPSNILKYKMYPN